MGAEAEVEAVAGGAERVQAAAAVEEAVAVVVVAAVALQSRRVEEEAAAAEEEVRPPEEVATAAFAWSHPGVAWGVVVGEAHPEVSGTRRRMRWTR